MKCAALLCLATACAAQTADTSSISGVVRDAGTGAPVADAGVTLQLPNGKTVAARVDAQGQYTLNGIPAGTYRVNASGPLETGQTLTPQQEKAVTLPAGLKVTSLDFRLPSMGIINGRVLDENNDPVSGADVFLVEKRYDHGALQYPLAGGSARTDDSGAYKLTGVPAGEAFLVETRVPRSTAAGDTPANTFYPNVLTPDLAAETILSPGERRSGVDIHRAKLPAYCVDGVVEGAPAPALDLELLDAEVVNSSHLTQRYAAGKTKPDGTFRVCGIHRGRYLLMASGSGAPEPGQMHFFAAETVAVTNDDVHDVKLPHAAFATISAEFVWDGDPSTQPPDLHGLLTLQGRSAGFNMAFTVPGGSSQHPPAHAG